MEQDIRKWILQCPQCLSKRATVKEKTECSPIEVTEPLELVGMDLVGKLTEYEITQDKVRNLVEREDIFEGLESQEAVFTGPEERVPAK
ncbi:hypothetical protein CgunFtcFv8_005082 [Champsocephalus gunnari]|uniref:Uncharacterized protein n=1 Tax=Champsocephalus gunnari TaxID=52237 RepID=A0AAN8CUV0_CHAGU|nr:hypothetical protein CgunFtcFv8_005082 [Champsocephalus gunnari]